MFVYTWIWFSLQVSVQSFHWLESCSPTYFGGLHDLTEFPRGTSVDFVPCTAFGISATDLWQVFYARIQQLSLWHVSGPKVLRFCCLTLLTRMWNTRHTKKVLESDQKGEESWSTGALLSMKPRPRTRRTRFRRVAAKIQKTSAISSILFGMFFLTCKVPVLERWRRLCEWGPGKRYKEDVACVVRVDD